MKTLPTLNSINFKGIECPMCKKYPNRRGQNKTPLVSFKSIRWNVETGVLELQGHCERCFKEWRLEIPDDMNSTYHARLKNPKNGEYLELENHIRRFA